jgi:activator of 2-hydroxyglutaryl-CoA dehydratase
MDAALAEAIDCPVTIAPDPQFTGALGAALLAGEIGGGPPWRSIAG